MQLFLIFHAATVSDLETKVDNLMGAQTNICDAIEVISQRVEETAIGGSSNGNYQYHCCVNANNGKMNCQRKQLLDVLTAIEISTTVVGTCGRCSTGQSGDPSSCSSYSSGYCDWFL